jgi:hypothetical protein
LNTMHTGPDVARLQDTVIELYLSSVDLDAALELHVRKPSMLSAALVELCRRGVVLALRELSS